MLPDTPSYLYKIYSKLAQVLKTCYTVFSVNERRVIIMEKTINLVVSDDLKAQAKKKAQSLGLSLSAYVRLLLSQEVNK